MNFDKQKVINLIQGTKASDITVHQINRISPKAETEAIAAIKAEHRKADSLMILTIRL